MFSQEVWTDESLELEAKSQCFGTHFYNIWQALSLLGLSLFFIYAILCSLFLSMVGMIPLRLTLFKSLADTAACDADPVILCGCCLCCPALPHYTHEGHWYQ